MAPDPLLKGLLQSVGGLDSEAAQRVLEAILDWRDADDLRRPNGAEAADYRAAGLKYAPTNGRFESTGELSRVLGVTPALMARLADSLTVHSLQRGINPATASRDVLLALPERHARTSGRVHRRPRRGAREPVADAAVRGGAGDRVRRGARMADRRRSPDARWCNLRARTRW